MSRPLIFRRTNTMKKSIRVISVILCALMVMSVFFVLPVFAADTPAVLSGEKTGKTGDCTWTFNEFTKTFTISGKGATADIDGLNPWYELGIKKVVVENGVTTIGERLFSNFGDLTSVTLPETLKEIKFCAFMNCNLLKSITLPSSLTSIDASAFQSCGFESVVIPNGVTVIEPATFYACQNLKSVTLPANLKSIKTDAFVNTALTEITLPSSIKTMGMNCVGYTREENFYRVVKGFKFNYSNCPAVDEYVKTFKANTPPDTSGITWEFKDGVLTINGTGETPWATPEYPAPWAEYYDKIKKLVIGNGITVVNGVGATSSLNSIEFSDTVEKINPFAFYFYENLTSVKFGNGLKEIGESAFERADLSKVVFPDSLRVIGNGAFDHCTNLLFVDFGNGVEEIDNYAFYECGFNSVTIPESVKKIGESAIGFIYDERYRDDGDSVDYGDFLINGFEIIAKKGSYAADYAQKIGAALVTGEASINKTSAKLKAGKTTKLSLKNSGVIEWVSSNEKVAVVDSDGKVTALKKGKAVITPNTPRNLKLSCTVKVTSNPKIKIGNKKFKAKTTYKITKKKTITVKISGKASSVKNKYTSSNKKVAKIISKRNAKKVKIKGYKRGKATITLKVNGVKFKIKVKVK